ncbi:MAG: 30S ribosomal protein S3 [Candidatus Peregrinibacteria bacterium]|nr:30S ribosomal protein S3 [Candidatus Peregrinibacteria bacterium]
MGQKINPKSLRVGIINTWDSRWFASKKDYAKKFHADLELKKFLRSKLKSAGVVKIEVERSAKKVVANISAAKPGLIIGRQGVAIEDLRDALSRKFGENIEVNIHEVDQPDLSAVLIAEVVVQQVEKRVAYRRAVKMGIKKAMEAGAKGVKIQISGRLNGVEISRSEIYKEGNIPLHTLRADIDYVHMPANTTYGVIGVKVWIYRGLVFKSEKKKMEQEKQKAAEAAQADEE